MILCLNLGSSSLKFSLFRTGEAAPSEEDLIASNGSSTENLDSVLNTLARDVHALNLSGIGHRVVFGGEKHVRPEIVTGELLESLERFIPLLPLHLPREIALMRAAAAHFPGVPQVACFDTAFHASMPAIAKRLPIARRLWSTGLRRYGFHGLSYEYIVKRLGDDVRGRVIVAHLGNGASLAALRDGSPMDTTMGLSGLGGLMMGTRPGDLDPGVVVSLMASGYDVAALNRFLEEECGLLGVSETSADVAKLLDRRATDARARDALDLFAYILVKHIGAMTAVLGGLDLLVFTGGIGENAAPVRDAVVAALPAPRPRIRVVPTNENLIVARHAYETIAALRA